MAAQRKLKRLPKGDLMRTDALERSAQEQALRTNSDTTVRTKPDGQIFRSSIKMKNKQR